MGENERLARVETNIDNIKDSVSEIKEMLKSHISSDEKWHQQIAGDFDDLDSRYAGKWTELILKGMLIAILGALVALVV